jgi:hypothetical protein
MKKAQLLQYLRDTARMAEDLRHEAQLALEASDRKEAEGYLYAARTTVQVCDWLALQALKYEEEEPRLS